MDYEKGKKLEEAKRKLTKITQEVYIGDKKINESILEVIDIIRDVLGEE